MIIPESIITKPPTAELRPNQTDQDSLPPYDVLDAVLAEYLRKNRRAEEMAKTLKLDLEFVEQIIRRVEAAEFKRRQAPPVVKIASLFPAPS
jgi:NH3-dependent NAD+ synthetase